jgi:hypothetical protein
VLDGWDLRGGVLIDGSDVTVRRSRIAGGWLVRARYPDHGRGSVRVADSAPSGDSRLAAVDGNRWSAERIEIVEVSGDGARLRAAAETVRARAGSRC